MKKSFNFRFNLLLILTIHLFFSGCTVRSVSGSLWNNLRYKKLKENVNVSLKFSPSIQLDNPLGAEYVGQFDKALVATSEVTLISDLKSFNITTNSNKERFAIEVYNYNAGEYFTEETVEDEKNSISETFQINNLYIEMFLYLHDNSRNTRIQYSVKVSEQTRVKKTLISKQNKETTLPLNIIETMNDRLIERAAAKSAYKIKKARKKKA